MIKRAQTNRIVFHHSLAKVSSASEIRKWHLLRDFEDIGYHFVVLRAGIVETGREIHLVGAHAAGKNSDSIGVCFEGDFRSEEPTEKQLLVTVGLYHGLCRAYSKNLSIEFHRDPEDDNPCPGLKFNRDKFISLLKTEGSIQ